MRFGFWWMNIIFKTVNGFMIHEILPKPPRGVGYLPFYYERFFSRLDRGIGFSYGLSFPPLDGDICLFIKRDSFPAWIGVLAFLIDFHFPHWMGIFAFLLKEILFPLGSGCWLFLIGLSFPPLEGDIYLFIARDSFPTWIGVLAFLIGLSFPPLEGD
jgi:hypothetical protein